MDFEQAVVELVRQGKVRIPPMPEAAMRLAAELARSTWTVDDLVAVLKTDQVLAAGLLRLANASAYARGEPVTELSVAVVRIGAQDLHRLALTSGLQQLAVTNGPLVSLRRRAWRGALASAMVCERLAALANDKAEESYVAGLLHDIGRLLAITCLETVLLAHPEEQPRDEAEWWALVENLHVELGLVLVTHWRLPALFEQVISGHHRAEAELTPLLRRVHAADIIVELLERKSHLTLVDLEHHTRLPHAECEALAALLPMIPEFTRAFSFGAKGPDVVSKVTPVPIAAAPKPLEVPVEISRLGGGPVRCTLVAAQDSSLTVESPEPVSVGDLVAVQLMDELDFSFCAKVGSARRGPKGYRAVLAPYALTRALHQRWVEFVAKITKGG